MKVLVVDDHVLFRDGLVSLLKSRPEYNVIGEASTVSEAVEKALLSKPDLILMDFSLPDGTGLEATQAILGHTPDCKIIFLTVSDEDEHLMDAIRSGARGYILKNVSISHLFASLQALEQGEMALSRAMSARIIEEFARSRTNKEGAPPALAQLSPRELDILAELTTGATNEEIASRLFLSPNTVKHHVHSILAKLDLNSRREAAQFAQKAGLRPS